MKEAKVFLLRKIAWSSIFFLLIMGLVLSTIIPPFQSPDEPAHVARAYLLTQGQIFLDPPPTGFPYEGQVGWKFLSQGSHDGGLVDTGLLAYIDQFEGLIFESKMKMSPKTLSAASAIQWSGKKHFYAIQGTGYYFPLAYAPQTVALLLGELFDLSLQHSYALARLSVLLCSLLVLVVAFKIFPANAFVLGLLVLPMSLFQFSSASLDGFALALTVLCMSLFMRGAVRQFSFPSWMSYLLIGCIFIVVTSREHLLPLLLCPLFLWFIRKKAKLLWQFGVATVLSLAWIGISIKHSYVIQSSSLSTSQIIIFYVKHPLMLIEALGRTLTDLNFLSQYINEFLGSHLGWVGTLRFLYTELPQYVVSWIFCMLMALLLLSIVLKDTTREEWRLRVFLLILFLVSAFLIFFAMLVTWNPLSASEIAGVQGRYFMGPLLLFGYALNGSVPPLNGKWEKIAIIPLFLIMFWVSLSMPQTLVASYYLH